MLNRVKRKSKKLFKKTGELKILKSLQNKKL